MSENDNASAPADASAATAAGGDVAPQATEDVAAQNAGAAEQSAAAPEQATDATEQSAGAPEQSEGAAAEQPAVAASTEEITYHAVEKDGQVTAIWEMQGRKHLHTIDPRSRQGQEILRLYTAEH
jgi:hypothetical protein